MLSLSRVRTENQVGFCERCGTVCDAACRSQALRDQELTRGVIAGWRQA